MSSPISIKTAYDNSCGANICAWFLASPGNNKLGFKQCTNPSHVANTFQLKVKMTNPIFIRTAADYPSGANISAWFLTSPKIID